MAATKKIRAPKARKATGKVNRRPKTKPITKADVEAAVNSVIDERSIFTIAGNAVGGVFSAVIEGLQNIANAVWSFCGKVYLTCRDTLTAMYQWLGAQCAYATGEGKKAFGKLRELVGSMNVESTAVAITKLVAAAAAIGLAITAGTVVGVTMAGLATSIGASATVAKIAGVLFAATTTMCVAEVVYALSVTGLSDEVIAAGMVEAQAKARALTPARASA